eukprot:TRINITY_DN321_c0_g1_i1.p1 TRINITY_DN321_c0_g1~~TRINITY_DN321_c0_g1_i1.p1  ORF type:complete len:1318 (-),score=385.46 TRINITY_DN321_c0_g1_i1:1104-5036(-)
MATRSGSSTAEEDLLAQFKRVLRTSIGDAAAAASPAPAAAKAQKLTTEEEQEQEEGEDLVSAVKSSVSRERQSDERARVQSTLQLLATTDAVASVIKAQKMKVTPTAVFAVALKSLLDSAGRMDKHSETFVRLLAFIAPNVPVPVFRSKASVVSSILSNFFHHDKTSTECQQALAVCCEHFIRALPMNPIQSEASVTLQQLIALAVSNRPAVQETAEKSVVSLIQADAAIAKHAATALSHALAAIFVQQQPRPERNKYQQDAASLSNALHVTERALPFVHAPLVASFTGTLFKTYTTGVATLGALGCFRSLVENPKSSLTSAFLASFTDSLIDSRPVLQEDEEASAQLYVAVVKHCLIRLASVDPNLCALKLTRGVNRLLPYLLQASPVSYAASKALKEVIGACISEEMVRHAAVSAASGSERAQRTPLEQLIALVNDTLGLRYRPAWAKALPLFTALFQAVGPNSSTLLRSVLENLCDLHDTPEFTHHAQLEAVVGAATSAMGVEKLLEVVPLSLEAPLVKNETGLPNRGWMLPILKSRIENADLGYFTTCFIPMADSLKKRASESARDKLVVEAKNLTNQFDQIWDLFPSFCKSPSGVAKAFPTLAPLLGAAVKDPSLTFVVCEGTKSLIEALRTRLDSENLGDKAEAENDLAVVGSFGRNFLPCLFNTLTGTKTVQRHFVLDAIRAYVSVTSAEVLNGFFKKVVTDLYAATKTKQVEEASRAQMLTDLTSAFTHYLDADNMSTVLKIIKPLLSSKDIGLQKRAWKTLALMCRDNEEFVRGSYDEIGATLIVEKPPAAARRMWLNCLRSVVYGAKEHQQWVTQQLLPHTMAHVILSIKEVNSKTRNVAYSVLVDIGSVVADFKGIGAGGFLAMLLAGLRAKGPRMVSATVLAIARSLYEFCALVDEKTLGQLLGVVLVLRDAHAREVCKAVLGFVKVVIITLPAELLRKHLGVLVEALAAYATHTSSGNVFRSMIKHTFVKLMRKYGGNEVLECTPEAYKKVVNNIRKEEEKKLVKRAVQPMGEGATKPKFENALNDTDSEDEDEDEDSDVEAALLDTTPRKRARADEAKAETRVLRDTDESVADLLDADSVDQHLKHTAQGAGKGKQKRFAKQDDVVRVDKDSGQIVVMDEDSQKPAEDVDDEDDDEPTMEDRRMLKRRKLAPVKKPAPAAAAAATAAAAPKIQVTGPGSKESRAKARHSSLAAKGRSAMYQRMMDRKLKHEEGKQKKVPKKFTGEKFAAKKAGGDITRDGTQPFAYVPLNPKVALRKRARAAAARNSVQFKGVIGGAKRGFERGSEQQRANKRQRR